ncbi:uncharacterized protein [Solanum lycopersicum]|uniref:uncharacterized protein n=1 Tax=Solanum lycopersicum TaxID=4081 RepID=UPI003748D538
MEELPFKYLGVPLSTKKMSVMQWYATQLCFSPQERILHFLKGLRSDLQIPALQAVVGGPPQTGQQFSNFGGYPQTSSFSQRPMLDPRECYGCGETGHIRRFCPKQSYKPPIIRGRGGHGRGRHSGGRGGQGNGGHQISRGGGQVGSTATQHGKGNGQTGDRAHCYAFPGKSEAETSDASVPFVWSDECEENFQKLETLLTTAPILTLPVEVLMQDKNVISYALRQLKVSRRPLAREVHTLANDFMRLEVLEKGGCLACVEARSSFLDKIKGKQLTDETLIRIREAHSSRYSIHPGATKMYRDLKKHFWWSRMKRDIVDFVAQCPNCQQVKLTMSAHFIPVKVTYNAEKLARLYISKIV